MQNRFAFPIFLILFASIFNCVNAQNNPKVDIVGPSFICQGDCANLAAVFMNIPTPVTYFWSGPGNFTSSLPEITVCPTASLPGTGSLVYSLKILGANGNVVASDTHKITILPYIPINITSSNSAPCNFDTSTTVQCEQVCPNSTVTYSIQDYPAGTNSFISWQVNGASSYKINNPPFNTSITVTWGGPGSGSVSVNSDGSGVTNCSGQDALCITIIPEPVAKFATTPVAGPPLMVCKGQTVFFQNQSTGADTYQWNFSDDVSTSTEANPQHTFVNPGNFTVTLIARSNCLCADTTSINVLVLDAVSPSLDCIGTVCPGAAVTYTVSNGCAPFNWSVSPNGYVLGGGLPTSDTIRVQWNDGPEGLITLGALSCSGNLCPTPNVLHVPVISDNAEIQGPARVCPGSTETYSIEPYGGTNFVWSVLGPGAIKDGQGTNKITVEWSNTPNISLTHWVVVKYDNCYLGCGGMDSLGVQILSPFVLDGPVEACENANGNLSAKLSYNNQPLNCDWSLSGPNGSVIWSSNAAATVAAPFIDGGGLYQVIAIPSNPNQTCNDVARWAVSVSALPSKPSGISGSPTICPGTTYTYEAQNVPINNNVRWTVQNGPGAPQTLQGNTINVTWGNNGPYSVAAAFVSTNGLNCSSDTFKLNVTKIGIFNITGDAVVCLNGTADYTMLSLQNTNIQWQINPSDAAAVADGQGTDHAKIFWTAPGGHVVSVAVCGQTASFPVTVIANPLPMVQHPTGLCNGVTAPVQTTNTFASYSWLDKNGVELSNIAAPLLPAGSYAVQVTDGNGCVGTNGFTIDTRPNPNLTISTADPTGFCNNAQFVTMTALSTADLDYTYQWFQNGNPVGSNSAVYSTNQYGSYTVSVTNQFGCSATAGAILLVNDCTPGGGYGPPGAGGVCPPGAVDIGVTQTTVCDSFGFKLINGGQYAPGTAVWQFGQSGASFLGGFTQDNVGYEFPNAGKYIAILTVQLLNGAFCFVVDSVDVRAHAQFDPFTGCPGDPSSFKDVSTFLPSAAILSWAWNFGDPVSGANNTSFLNDPTHVFDAGGTYQVKLTLTDQSGCTASQTQTVEVPATSPLNFNLPTAHCTGNALEFTATGTPDITDVHWDFGNPASGAANNAGGIPVYHNFSPPGTYSVTAVTTNIYGCTASFTKNITIEPNPLSGTISPANPGALCEGATITLTAPAGAVSYFWSDSTTTTQTFVVHKSGSYSVTMTDANSCTYVPPPVKVDVTPSPDALIKALIENEAGQIIGTAYPTLNTCSGENVHLSVIGNGSYSYNWSGGNGTSTEVFFSVFRGNPLTEGTHTYTVTVTDATSGCTAVTNPFVVTVNPVPAGFSIAANGSCANNANILTYTGPTPANWQLIWNNGQIGSSINTENPGVYYVRVLNEFGCEARSNPVTILPGPAVSAIPSGCHTRCTPDTLCLPPIPNIASWQWFFNGAPIPGATTSNLVATQNGSYWAELTDVYGCSAQSDPLTLNLYQGYGNIDGKVWSDVNNNGIIDGTDTLVTGIPVQLILNGSIINAMPSDVNGNFMFHNILSTDYTVIIDPFTLTPNWAIVIGQAQMKLLGCNDVAKGDLLVRFVCQPSASTVQLTACAGAAAVFHGTQVPAGTTQLFTLTNVQGCDSLVTVNVAALPISTGSVNVAVCPGTKYNYNGTMLNAGSAKQFVLTNYLGCDSLVTVSVGVLPTSSSVQQVKVCPGSSYDYFGIPIGIGQSVNFTFSNYLGCDSIVTISVSAYSVQSSSFEARVCPGDTFNYFGSNLAIGDVATFTLSSVITGCDSVVTVRVKALPTFSSAFEAQVCPGSAYSYQNENLAPGDVKAFTLSSVITGCDSVVTVSVKALPTFSSAFTARVCPGEKFTYQNKNLAAGDVKPFTLASLQNGCDSVVTVTVVEKPESFDSLAVSVCPGTVYTYQNVDIPAGGSHDFHYFGYENCDSTFTVTVAAYPDLSFDLQAMPSCTNNPTGVIDAQQVSGGLAPFQYSIDGTSFQDSPSFTNLVPGNYTIYVQDANDCLFSRDTVIAPIPALSVSLSNGILPCDSSGVRMAPIVSGDSTALSYLWWNGAQGSTVTVLEPGKIWVEVHNACETIRKEASVTWADFNENAEFVYVPNVMAPEALNPENSQFRPFFPAGLVILRYKFEVFDRWGNLMFRDEKQSAGWNGAFRTRDFKPGVCVWQLVAKISYCGQEIEVKKKGDVTVVR